MSLVHGLHEALAGAIGALALGTVIDREFALEDIGEQRHRMHVPSGLLPRRERDFHRGDAGGRAGRIADRLAGHGGGGRDNNPLVRMCFASKWRGRHRFGSQ